MFLYCTQYSLVTQHFITSISEGDRPSDIITDCTVCGATAILPFTVVKDKLNKREGGCVCNGKM